MEIINKTKRQATEWDKIIANDVTNKGVMIQDMQTAHTFQYQKKTQF